MTAPQDIRGAILRTAERIQRDAAQSGRPMTRDAAIEKARLVAVKFFKKGLSGAPVAVAVDGGGR